MLRNRPGPLAALIATVGTGREVGTLTPRLGDAGLAQDIVELAPDAIVAEEEDWARVAVLDAAEKAALSRCGPEPTAPWPRRRSAGRRIRPCGIAGMSPC